MAESGEPALKKAKTHHDIFTKFVMDFDLMLILKHGKHMLKYGCRFRCCGIKYTNFNRTCSFTHADIQAASTKPALNQTYMFGDLFVKGISLLENYINYSSPR